MVQFHDEPCVPPTSSVVYPYVHSSSKKEPHLHPSREREGLAIEFRSLIVMVVVEGRINKKSAMDLWFNHLAAVGHACCCLGNYHGCLIERELFGVRVNKTTHDFHHGFHQCTAWAFHLLGLPCGSSTYINRPTSLMRGEGHLMCLSSMRASSGGDGDDSGGMSK